MIIVCSCLPVRSNTSLHMFHLFVLVTNAKEDEQLTAKRTINTNFPSFQKFIIIVEDELPEQREKSYGNGLNGEKNTIEERNFRAFTTGTT